VTGILAVFALIGSQRAKGLMAVYLLFAVLTSATGFGFLPITKLLPSHIVGIISLVLLAIAILARYAFHLAGAWRWIFAVLIVITVYLDAFVFVTQLFLKVPSIHALAPHAPDAPEPPFALAQGGVLVVFLILLVVAAVRFHPRAVE